MNKLIQLSTLFFVVLFSMPSNAAVLYVQVLIDGKNYTQTVELRESDSIWSLKQLMAAKTSIPIDKQRIITGGVREAKNNEKISSIPEDHRSRLKLVKIPDAPQVVDNLLEARNNFNAYLRSGDHDMARASAQSILGSRRYTTPEKDEARSWLAKLPQEIH